MPADPSPKLTAAREALVECGAHTVDDVGNHGLCRRPLGHPGFCDPTASLDPYRRHLATAFAEIDRLTAENEHLREANESQSYKGNSVRHWWAKAAAYGGMVHGCSEREDFEQLGFRVET